MAESFYRDARAALKGMSFGDLSRYYKTLRDVERYESNSPLSGLPLGDKLQLCKDEFGERKKSLLEGIERAREAQEKALEKPSTIGDAARIFFDSGPVPEIEKYKDVDG